MSQADALAGVLERLKASPADEDAWRHLYLQLRPFVIAVIYRRLKGGERKAAEDAAQEVFLRLLRTRPFDRIPDADALRAYVWRMADNVAKTHLRKLQATEAGERDLAAWRSSAAGVAGLDSEGALLAGEVHDFAENALDPTDRDLLRLLLAGSRLDEAADRVGLTYANAGVRLYRIRRKLVDLLNR
jgi:RNA polymerase sigma factor (sigma-70 family)